MAVLVACVCSGPAAADEPGKRVFDQWCAGCHADSPFAPGTIALKASRGEDQAVLEQRKDLAAVTIEVMVRRGFAGMPSFRRTEISADELAALVRYLAPADETGAATP